MPTLYLLCGLPGAGKTTLAKQLERDRPVLRLTPDEWMARVVGDGFDEKKRAAVEALLWEIAARALRLGLDVALDFGFWSRSEREDFRARAAALGAHTKVLFVDAPDEELLRRLARRNGNSEPDTFEVSANQLRGYSELFERPTPDELV